MLRLRALSSLVLLSLLAGCAASPDDGPDAAGPSPADGAAGRFLAPLDLSGREGGPEPVIAIGPDGAIWIAAQDAAGDAPRVWRSGDAGATFRVSRPSSVRGGEVDIAVGSRAAYVTQLGPGGNVVSFTRDQGATWSQSAFTGTNYFERELVAVDGAGSVYLASRFGLRSLTGGQLEGDDATVARSDDGGITFAPGGRIWDETHEPGTTIGNMLSVGDAIMLSYNCRDGTGVCFASSADRGATWTQRLIVARSVDVANVYPILAASPERLAVAWSDASEGRLAVWGAWSSDRGASWSAPAKLSGDDETATLAWIAMGGGRSWVAYLSTDVALDDAGSAAAQDAVWLARAARLSADLAVEERALVLDDVHRGVISKPIGRPGASGPFDRSFGDFFTLALDAEGRAHVAIVRTVGGGAHDLLVIERR